MGDKSDICDCDAATLSGAAAPVRDAVESGGVVVLHGPAGSGKTTIALELYEHYCDSLGRPRCCIITPNSQHREYVTSQLLQRSPCGVLTAPQIITFAQLAGRVLGASQSSVKSISPLERYFLLRKIVTKLSDAGKLPTFAPVAHTTGIVTALDRAIAELKRAAVDENDLAYALHDTQGKSRDLLSVYTAYQHYLRQMQLFDVEGQMWQGRDDLKNAPDDAPNDAIGLGGIDVIIADGFTDFTPTQLEMLTLLVPRVRGMLITLPHADDPRERMWFWTQRTLKRIRTLPVANITEITIPSPPTDASEDSLQIKKILPRIFDHDAEPCDPPSGLSIVAATDIDSEVTAVARKIKRLLIDGANPGSIGVIARSIETYHEAIYRIFSECDIPVTPPAAGLGDVPVVRFFLNVAALSESNFAFADVLHIIGNSYFDPQMLGEFSRADIATAQCVIREGNVCDGRESYLAAFERAENRAAVRSDDPGNAMPEDLSRTDHTAINRAWKMLQRLFDIAEKSRGADEGLLELIETLGLRRSVWNPADLERSSRDMRAVDSLTVVIESLGSDAAKIDIENFREGLSRVSLPPIRSESLVDVTSVLDARGVRWEHVFVLGCGEGQFPQKVTDLSLLSETERAAWNQRGIDLDRRSDLTAREMLLFYLAVSRADKTLTLSYHQLDAAGGASGMGSFLQSLVEVVGGADALEAAGKITRVKPGEFVPVASELITPRETLNAAITGLFQSPEQPASPQRWITDNRSDVLGRVGCGLWASRRRWGIGSCNEFDGQISDDALLGLLAKTYPGEAVFSASRLNMFAQCPWKYFATYVLNLKPLAEPEDQLEAVSLGIFCHDVLFSTLTELAKKHSRPLRLKDVDAAELFETFEENFDAEAARVESRNLIYPMLWKIQQCQMQKNLRDYLEAQHKSELFDFECLNFELGFGVAGEGDHIDPASIADPVTISTTAGDVKLCGKIDRVDRAVIDGVEGLFVVDYKTGKIPAGSKNSPRQNLQMPLYTAALEQIFGCKSVGGAYHSLTGKADGYYGCKKSGERISLVDGFAQQRAAAMDTVGAFVTSMQQGRFDLPSAKPDICKYCEFREVCHFSPVRSEVKFPAASRGGDA